MQLYNMNYDSTKYGIYSHHVFKYPYELYYTQNSPMPTNNAPYGK